MATNNLSQYLKESFCPKPFEYLDIHYVNDEFRCYLCCPTWLPVPIGDLEKKSLQEVWNGNLAKEIRKSILIGSYLYCVPDLCPDIQSRTLQPKEYIYKEEYREYLNHKEGQVPHGPRIVYFSEDRTCNLACPSCRKDYISLESDTLKKISEARERFLPDLMKDVESLNICSSGDPFSSKIYKDFLFEFNGTDYPKLKINLNTNGVLLTQSVFSKMKKIHSNLSNIIISIDAAREATYNIVRKGGHWNPLLENIRHLVKMRRENTFDHLQLDFVVQDHNYREMPLFVELGKELGVDKVYFQRVSNWGTFSESEFKERDILNPSHPLHQHFKEVCRHPLMRDEIVKRGNLSSFIPLSQKEEFIVTLRQFKPLRKLVQLWRQFTR